MITFKDYLNESCDCWKGHKRVPGTKPCAPGSCVKEDTVTEGERGLWDNIHAKRKRIKNGSGEKMRKPGSKGAPTDAAFKAANEEAELDETSLLEYQGDAKESDKDHDPAEYKRYHKIFHNAWHHGYMSSNGGQTAVNTAANIARGYQSSDKSPRSHRNALEKARKDVVLSKGAAMKEEVVAEAGPFSYGAKTPRKGSVADLAAKKRKEQERGKQPIEPRDQQVGVAKVTKGVAEATNDYFKRRKDEEDRIAGTKPPAKRTPKQTDYEKKRKQQGVAEELTADEKFDLIEELVMDLAEQNNIDPETLWEKFELLDDDELYEAAVDAKGHKSSTGGLTQKGRDYYNRQSGGNLKAPVTTKPSKLKPGSKAANRRKSFCARMSGVDGPMKKPNGEPTRKALALRKWNC